MKKRDYREFLFTATGADTDPGRLTSLELADNLIAELAKLEAMIHLLEAQRELPEGVASLLDDIHQRMRATLDHFVAAGKRSRA